MSGPTTDAITYAALLDHPAFTGFAFALISHQVHPRLAWAATLRVFQIAMTTRASYEHTVAGKDPALRIMGFSRPAAMALMTALTGSRRGATRGFLSMGNTPNEDELDHVIATVVLPHLHPQLKATA
ncbi:hypothetical protein H8R18_00645 [Nanchangia anserum]|uniref:hypothetical protein n=1 Tax=Nanchangia anserum TaxID=2692125 RepID=UPI00188328E8|nr:hypothetical protein [Nanchangia anserum]QOX81923.1 hypothetical protein H8R18_00645 [Nanchangia anserum]